VGTGQPVFLLFRGMREHSNGFVCSWEHIKALPLFADLLFLSIILREVVFSKLPNILIDLFKFIFPQPIEGTEFNQNAFELSIVLQIAIVKI
jgi:hypothetical protein